VALDATDYAYLGHADVRSTRRYARLADQTLVEVRPRRRAEVECTLSASKIDSPNPLDSKEEMVEAAGIEPAAGRRKRLILLAFQPPRMWLQCGGRYVG